MTENLKSNEHKCPFCKKAYSCNYDCGYSLETSCNDCYDKGLIE